MQKFKKALLTVLSMVLVAVVAVGATLAYLTDTDSDVNVMTVGNVKIEQHEYQRATNEDGTYKTATIDNMTSYVLEDFEQAKPLLPATEIDANGNPVNNGAGGYSDTIVRMTQVDSYGYMQVFASENAQDKFVTVENTGKTDAYVRTLVAIECGTGDASLIGIGTRCVPAEDAATSTAPWVSNVIGKITVDNNAYTLFEYVYRGASDVNRHVNGVLPAGDTTYPSLCQVYLKSAATNEDMEAIDGNDNGTLDILVLSQAVQAAGFENAQTALDTAFGDITVGNNPWVTTDAAGNRTENAPEIPTVVSTADELTDALAEGGSVVLADDMNPDEQVVMNGGVLDGNGKTITANLFTAEDAKNGKEGWKKTQDIHVTEGTIKNLTFVASGRGIGTADNLTGNLVIDHITADIGTGSYLMNYGSGNGYSLSVSNSTIRGWNTYGSGFASLTFNNVTFDDTQDTTGINNGTIYGNYTRVYQAATFTNCHFNGKAVLDIRVTDQSDMVTLVDCYVNGKLIESKDDIPFSASYTAEEIALKKEHIVIVNN